jgi:hypothetical protein
VRGASSRSARSAGERTTDESARGAQAYNTAIAAHPRLESIVLPILRDTVDGLAISIVK